MTQESPVTVKDVRQAAKNEDSKICFICEANNAKFCIKNKPSDCYCYKCAKDTFGDTTYLERL